MIKLNAYFFYTYFKMFKMRTVAVKIKDLHLSLEIVLTRQVRWRVTQQKHHSSFRDDTSIFLPFQKWCPRVFTDGGPSKDGIVWWERLYMTWWSVIHVTVSRVWALALSSEALVHNVPLLTPPGRLVSPPCRTKLYQKVLTLLTFIY